jgi:cephalosporin hydroxylase
MVRLQEVIFKVKPDVIIETGVAHGGSLVFSASLCKALGKGRVIGIDIEIRPQNRKALEEHFLAEYLTLVEGSSTSTEVVSKVKSLVKPSESVLIILDSCHTKDHVLGELEAYHPLVTPESYIIATDGIMKDLADLDRAKPDWEWNNPTGAAEEFAKRHPEFSHEQPEWPFSESQLKQNVTHWPAAYLRRLRNAAQNR